MQFPQSKILLIRNHRKIYRLFKRQKNLQKFKRFKSHLNNSTRKSLPLSYLAQLNLKSTKPIKNKRVLLVGFKGSKNKKEFFNKEKSAWKISKKNGSSLKTSKKMFREFEA